MRQGAMLRSQGTAMNTAVTNLLGSESACVSVMPDDVHQRAMHAYSIDIILDESPSSKLVHEEAACPARGTDHLCQGLLFNLGDKPFRFSPPPRIRQQQKQARKPLLTGIDE